MRRLAASVKSITDRQKQSGKPLAVILAGHNGSGKSTLWYRHLAETFRIPLINADRMMMSILPEDKDKPLPKWASDLRDKDQAWMAVAQNGVKSFVAQAMAQNVPFATETVFSHWEPQEDGSIASKIDTIRQLQGAGYFVLLIFVGLGDVGLSIARVNTRALQGGHTIPWPKLHQRFPRTQKAINAALPIADAAILTDNSRTLEQAFSVVRVQAQHEVVYDIRTQRSQASPLIEAWMTQVCGPVME